MFPLPSGSCLPFRSAAEQGKNALAHLIRLSKHRRAGLLQDLVLRERRHFVSHVDILNSLANREKLGSTGLGHGVAIPHGRMSGISGSVGAFVRLKHPVDYETHDGQPVDLVFGLLVPQHATGEHLQHLAAIAEKFSDDAFCTEVREAADEAALYALLTR